MASTPVAPFPIPRTYLEGSGHIDAESVFSFIAYDIAARRMQGWLSLFREAYFPLLTHFDEAKIVMLDAYRGI